MTPALARVGLVGALLAIAVAGCSPAGSPSAPPSAPAAEHPPAAVVRDFPDPDILRTDEGYVAFATNANRRNVQLAVSTDLASWELLADDALPELPSWVIPGKTWAPEVTSFEPGRFTMYFTATDAASGRQCIGRAVSDDARGPFEAVGEGMLVCPVDEGGAIDAAVAWVDEAPYLVWKNDGNCCGLDTWLYASPLAADGSAIVGERIPLIRQTEGWEGDLVEAPTLIDRGRDLALLYSANAYGGDAYAIGMATAPALGGPWQKRPEPVLTTESSPFRGPGGQDLVEAPDGSLRLALHSWNRSYSAREMHLVPASWGADGDLELDLE